MVELRFITLEDTPLVVKWRNNPEVKKNFICRNITGEDHEKWMRDHVSTGKVVQFIIELDNKPVGSVYLRDIDKKNNSAELGIFIGEDSARCKGIGKEAINKAVEYGFTRLNLHRIFLRLLSGNDSAKRCYEKAGFKMDGIARDMVYLDNEYKDIIFMSIIENGDNNSA